MSLDQGTGVAPPIFFRLAERKCAAPGGKEKMPAQNGAAGAFFAHVRGDPERDCGWKLLVKAFGAVLVLAISISFASGLRRKLTHFDARPLPTKTAALGFRGGPYFAETSGFPPATDCHRGPGCRTDLTPSSPPLPLCPARGKLRARGAHPAAGGPTPRPWRRVPPHRAGPPFPRLRLPQLSGAAAKEK